MSVRPIRSRSGPGALLLIWLLQFAGLLLRPYSYRGIGTLSRILGKWRFTASHKVVVELFRNSLINVDLDDYYWSRLLFADFEYETEVARVLDRHLGPNAVFLDLGANIGYWSIRASETITDPRHIVAVEAGGRTFERLSHNATLNNHPFTAIRAAVAERDGETVSFVTPGGHAGAHVAGADEAIETGNGETVETRSIDGLMATFETEDETPVIIKLDVEGAEVHALKGAKNTLARAGVMVIYEDHGNDRQCTVSRHVIEELGFDVYMIEGADTGAKANLAQIAAVKVDPLKGYNFVAVPPGTPFKMK